MNYGNFIKDAFWITLRNPYLWFFGFFAGAGGGSTNFGFPSGSGDFDMEENGRQASARAVLAAQQTAFDNLALLVALVALALVILLVFVILSLISQGALAESV